MNIATHDPNCWLLHHAKNISSQTGEDGIIRKCLATISDLDKWCVEFGAWDGLHLSNTRPLIEELDYSAILIEGDRDLSRVTWLFSGYDGSVHIAGHNSLVWHGLQFSVRSMQQLPRFLRKFPDHYNPLERLLFKLIKASVPLKRRLLSIISKSVPSRDYMHPQ